METARERIVHLFLKDQEICPDERHVLRLLDEVYTTVERDRDVEKLTAYLTRSTDVTDYAQNLAANVGLHIETTRDHERRHNPKPKIVEFHRRHG